MSKKSEQVEENEEEYDPSENKRKGRDPVRDMQKKQLEKLMAHPVRMHAWCMGGCLDTQSLYRRILITILNFF